MTGSEAASLGHPLLVLFRLRPDFVVVGAGDSFQPGRHAPLKFPFRAAQLAPREAPWSLLAPSLVTLVPPTSRV